MKKMMKRAIALLAIAAIAAPLASCGNGGSQTNSRGKVEIRIVTNERSKMEDLQERADEFNETNDKNISIVFDFKGDNVTDLIKTGYTSKSAPDIHIGMGGAMDLIAKDNGWYRKVPEETVNEWSELYGERFVKRETDGKVYELGTNNPIANCSGYKFLWNKDLFREAGLNPDEAPATWNDVREYAKKITEIGEGKKYGYVMPFKDAIFTRYYIVIPGATSGLFNADGFDPRINQYDYSVYEPLIQVYRDIIADGSVFPSPYTIDNDTARAQFAEGNIGMICAAGWDVDVFNEQFEVKNDWGIGEYPVLDEFNGGYPYGVPSGGSNYFMSAMSQHPEEQLEVYKWLLTPDERNNQKKLAQKGREEFSIYKYPLAKMDDASNPGAIIKVEGDDCWTQLKDVVLGTGDITEGLAKISDSYNSAMDKAAAAGEDMEVYHDPDYSFFAQNEAELN
ncbi:MAG: extracellular solute-binding protein [Clostridia bacterium]|nr:extracellular solute-binding protein [Clostridia bacterium]